MLKKTLLFLLGLFTMLTAHAQSAHASDLEIYELEEMFVTATQSDAPEYDMSVITETEIERPSGGASVIDVLRNEAGIQLLRATSTTDNNIRLRAFGESRLRIEIDGIPSNLDGSYGGSAINWNAISTEQVEQIEIQRGAVSAKYGNTLGGVIDIISKKPTEEPETSVSATYGDQSTFNTTLDHSARAGSAWWTLTGSHFETDGYLRNDTNDRNNFAVKLGIDLPYALEIGGGFEFSDIERGLIVENDPDSAYYDSAYPVSDGGSLGGPSPRMSGTAGDGSYADDTGNALTAFLSRKFANTSAKLSFRLWNRERTEYYYDIAEPKKKMYERETKIEDGNWTGTLGISHELDNHTVEWGAEYKQYGWGDQSVTYMDMDYFNTYLVEMFYYIKEGFMGQPRNKTYAAVYAQDTWKFHPDWDLEIGLRQEWYESDKVDPEAFGFDWDTEEEVLDHNHLDPRGALTWRPWENGSISARLGIAHRYPTSGESFWWYLNKGSEFFNTTLEPEEAVQYELGLEQRLFSRADLTLRGYYYDIENYITSTTVQGYGQVVYNIDDVVLKGVETELSVYVTGKLRAWGNFTWQDGKKSGDHYDTENLLGNQLANVPATMVNLGVDCATDQLMVRLSMNHVASRDRFEEDEVETLGAYTLLNAYATYSFPEGDRGAWQLLLSVDNILDEDYEESEGYSMPGITTTAGVKVTF